MGQHATFVIKKNLKIVSIFFANIILPFSSQQLTSYDIRQGETL